MATVYDSAKKEWVHRDVALDEQGRPVFVQWEKAHEFPGSPHNGKAIPITRAISDYPPDCYRLEPEEYEGHGRVPKEVRGPREREAASS